MGPSGTVNGRIRIKGKGDTPRHQNNTQKHTHAKVVNTHTPQCATPPSCIYDTVVYRVSSTEGTLSHGTVGHLTKSRSCSCNCERAGHGVTAGLTRRRVARLSTANADRVSARRHFSGPVPLDSGVLPGPELKAELVQTSCRDQLPRKALQRPERDR